MYRCDEIPNAEKTIGGNKMKRISLFLLVLVCLLSAAACALADSLTYALL